MSHFKTFADRHQGREPDKEHQRRGRTADRPRDIPPRGWKDAGRRTWQAIKADHVSLLAAGVAFYALLAIVPALVAVVSIYGLVASPTDVASNVADFLKASPREVQDMIAAQLRSITSGRNVGLSIGAVLGLVAALWSASGGVRQAIEGINIAYGDPETRGFVKLRLLSLALTLGAIVFFLMALAMLTFAPAALAETGLGTPARVALNLLRWPLLAAGLLIALSVFYRYAPNRAPARWRWVSPGALAATAAWLVGSILFSIFTANFGRYNETYGSLGAIIVVMLWLYLTAFAVLAGAELNAELERQTMKDTTTGPPRPLGQRGAYAADTLGATPP
jgi:membrane protein